MMFHAAGAHVSRQGLIPALLAYSIGCMCVFLFGASELDPPGIYLARQQNGRIRVILPPFRALCQPLPPTT